MRALRIVYALNFLGLGFMAWSSLIRPSAPWGLMDGVVVSYWAENISLADDPGRKCDHTILRNAPHLLPLCSCRWVRHHAAAYQ